MIVRKVGHETEAWCIAPGEAPPSWVILTPRLVAYYRGRYAVRGDPESPMSPEAFATNYEVLQEPPGPVRREWRDKKEPT